MIQNYNTPTQCVYNETFLLDKGTDQHGNTWIFQFHKLPPFPMLHLYLVCLCPYEASLYSKSPYLYTQGNACNVNQQKEPASEKME